MTGGISALIAFKGLLVIMLHHMPLQMARVRGGIITLVAFVGFVCAVLSFCVNFDMGFEITKSAKCFLAVITNMRLLSSMCQIVKFELST